MVQLNCNMIILYTCKGAHIRKYVGEPTRTCLILPQAHSEHSSDGVLTRLSLGALHVGCFLTNSTSLIIEYGSTPYVGLTPKKYGHHTLVHIYFRLKTNDTVQLETGTGPGGPRARRT